MPRQKAPKPAKLPRPKTKDLRMMLKGLLTVSLGNRIATLSYAMQWYDGALPYMMQRKLIPVSTDPKTPTKEQIALNFAVKARKHGIGATIDEEKETAFLTAIRKYEVACHKIKPPHVDKFYNMFKNQKAKLEQKQSKMASKFGSVVTVLQKAIGNRVKVVVADAVKEFQYDPSLTTLSFNREAAKKMAIQLRTEGILPLVVDKLPILTRHAALQSDGKGGWLFYPEKQVEVMNEVLRNFLSYAVTPEAPKRLVRQAPAPAAQGAPQAASTTPRPKGTFGGQKGPKIGGIYVPGTCGAIFYERLSDGKEWTLDNLFAGVAHAHPIGPLKKMAKDGPAHGWTVLINNNKAKLQQVTP